MLPMRPMSAITPFRAPRRARMAAATTALACTLMVVTAPVGAAPTADPRDQKTAVDRQIAALKDQLHDTSADLSNAYIALRTTQAALPTAQAKLDRANAALRKAEQHNDAMAAALAVARANEARARDELAKSSAEIEETRTRVAHVAARMYQDQGLGQLSVALSATSPDEFATRIAMTDTVMAVQNRSLDRLSTVRAAATAQQAHVEALRQDVARAKAAAERSLKAAASARGKAASAKAQLDALAAQQARQAAAVSAKKAAEQRKLNGMQAESQRLQRVLVARAKAAKAAAARAAAKAAAARKAREAAARAAASRAKKRYVPPPAPAPAPQVAAGFLQAPSSGWISSEFGQRYHPILSYWRLHAGRDYAADCGTPVYAAASGSVIGAGDAGGYGNRIMIDHGVHRGVNLVTTYNHLSRFAVGYGQVSKGTVVGYVGTTGTSTGCHLHFEVYEDGTPVDPRSWL